MKIQNYSYFI